MQAYHEPVLCEEVLELLLVKAEGIYVDATIGGGGHAARVCELLNEQGRLIGFDSDGDAIEEAGRCLARFGDRVTLIRANFRHMREELQARGIQKVSGVLLDLGVSSNQLESPSKGFSFRADQVLDMRMDKRQKFTALDVVNAYAEGQLTTVLEEYGEERRAREIARAIVRARPIKRTAELGAVIESRVGARYLTKTLARVFQAIRVEVNGELTALREALGLMPELLLSGGRCAVISYHSLEDRIVKQYFQREAAESLPSVHKLLPVQPKSPTLEILTRKPIIPSSLEISRNPRARSAKLRAAMRCFA